MSEYKTLLELWKEAGEKPFDAVVVASDNEKFHCVCIAPDGDALGWDAHGTAYIHSTKWSKWKFAPPKKRKVKMWPAVYYDKVINRYYLSRRLYRDLEDAHDDGFPPEMVTRLLTEWPAVEVEVDE